MLKIYRGDLSKYGFTFDNFGDVTNMSEMLNILKDNEDIEKINKVLEEYIDIQRDQLPDAIKEWETLNSVIKDSYKEQLDITKEIEDKITKVYKKQVEDRIDLVKKELDERLKALDKQKQAYNDARAEIDYNRDYEDHVERITELQKKLDIAMKDDSLSGQKRVQELFKEIIEEQAKLEDMVQDKIDDQINDMFDKESERLENEADSTIKDLEEKFSDSKIAQLVANALGSGVFKDIEGNVFSLEDVLINFS